MLLLFIIGPATGPAATVQSNRHLKIDQCKMSLPKLNHQKQGKNADKIFSKSNNYLEPVGVGGKAALYLNENLLFF